MTNAETMNDELNGSRHVIHHSAFIFPRLFRFLVRFVATAETAELAELQPFRRSLLILRRNVITMLAFRALQHNIIARHNLTFPEQ
jgi:hypothetical protein